MNKKQLTILSILVIFTLSACGGASEPTLTAADVEGTAVANAWIALTQTQAALPTQTPSPIPTETFTPLPTMTAPALILPTLAPPTLAVATNPADDPCNLPPPAEPKGLTVKVKFVNKSGGQAALSFGMNFPNKIGECGTYGVKSIHPRWIAPPHAQHRASTGISDVWPYRRPRSLKCRATRKRAVRLQPTWR